MPNPIPFAIYPPLPSAAATANPTPPAVNPAINPLGITGPYLFVVDSNGNVYPGQINAQPASGVSGMFVEVVQSVVATGVNQAGAAQVTGQTVKITGGSGGGVALPVSQAGFELLLINRSGGAVQVYGFNNGVDVIDQAAFGTGVPQMNNSLVIYTCPVAGEWETEGLSTGFDPSVGLQTLQVATGLTASTTQTQAAGTPITALVNIFTTVANIGNAATLMDARTTGAALSITVVNAGANSMNIFPNAGGNAQQINALGANNAFALAAAKSATFVSNGAGQWYSVNNTV